MSTTPTTRFNAKNKIKITDELRNECVVVSKIHGIAYSNPCSVCDCTAAQHLLRRGEVICSVHGVSCSKELGLAMREKRLVRERESGKTTKERIRKSSSQASS